MSNQSGKIVLILVLFILLIGVGGYLYFSSANKDIKTEQSIENTRNLGNSETLVPSEVLPTSVACTDNLNQEFIETEVWNSLSDELKRETRRKGVITEAQATYEIYLYAPSPDCKYIAVLLELVGRGAGAYTPEDFLNRQVYIFDLESKKNIPVIKLDEKLSFEGDEYGSNIWKSDKEFEFILSEDVKQGEFTGTRYLFNVGTRQLEKAVEEN